MFYILEVNNLAETPVSFFTDFATRDSPRDKGEHGTAGFSGRTVLSQVRLLVNFENNNYSAPALKNSLHCREKE